MSDSNSASFAEPASSSPPTRPGAARYRVFLSYSHADTKWARWLMRRLELYRVPRRFHGRAAPIGEVGWRIAPVFRDRDELPTTSDLGETIRAALRESATLVVICSPSSAKSRWVQEEILAFKRLGGERRVFAFIVSGEPKVAGAVDDCFPAALRAEIGADGNLSTTPAEVVAADARPEGDGPKLALIRLVAGLLGVGFDELRQRELQRRSRRLMVITGCSLAGMALTFGLAVVAWQARNDARRRQDQAEDVLTFMLGDFREELKKIGRLGLLNEVGQKATAYFDTLDARDLSDTALTRQARALRQIGEIRFQEARYAEAINAFITARQRAGELVARQPTNGDVLFERAQAEYWIGISQRRLGDFPAATTWLQRYRDTGAALVALNPREPKWQTELGSGEHNLAVLRMDQGEFETARTHFVAKRELLQRMVTAQAENLELRFRLSDTESWLGSLAERRGRLAEALAHFEREGEMLAALSLAEPGTARWRVEMADNLSFQADLLAVIRRRSDARALLQRARVLFEGLVAHDPANRVWQVRSFQMRLKEVMIDLAGGDAAGAAERVTPLRQKFAEFAAATPKDTLVRSRLSVAWWIEAEVHHAARDAKAYDLALRAVELAEGQIQDRAASQTMLADLARVLVAAGRMAGAVNRGSEAEHHGRRVLEVLGPYLNNCDDWRLLDPAARAYALVGRGDDARRIISRLDRFGYTPLQPWPVLAPPISPSENQNRQPK